MARNRYFDIQRSLAFGQYEEDELLEDGLLPIKDFVKLFNEHREGMLSVGEYLLVDELMVPFKSRKSEWNHLQGAIAVYKIKRKPKGIGLQFKGMVDCSSKIMMRLELCEGKGQGKTEFEDAVGPSAAVVMRLTQPWFKSGRVVVADSAFSSVSLAMELQKQGLHYIGSLKTSTARFPIKKLSKKPLKRGETFAMEAKDPESDHKVLAVAWKDKGKKNVNKTLVAT